MHAFGQVVNSCRHSASPLKSARRRYSGRKTGASAEASGVGVVPLTERGRVQAHWPWKLRSVEARTSRAWRRGERRCRRLLAFDRAAARLLW